MKKNISILVSVPSPGSPSLLRRLVETAINQAAYKEGLQFIFAIDQADKVCLQEVHSLYNEHQPSLFDSLPIPTIKLMNRDKSVYADMIEKADAPFVMPIEPNVYFAERNWDKLALEDLKVFKQASGLYYRMGNFSVHIARKESVLDSENENRKLKAV
jgi:hypothetical protein